MVNANTHKERQDVIIDSLSCLTAGSLFITIFFTIPLQFPINYLIIIVGVLLLLLSPMLCIFIYKEASITKAQKLLRVARPTLGVATLLSIAFAGLSIISLFHDLKLPVLAVIFLIYIILCLILFIFAQAFLIFRR